MTALVDILDAVEPTRIPPTPDAFLETLRGPTAFRVRGRDRSRMRAVVGMLHGNEPSGLHAIHAVLRDAAPPATDVVFFLGAVEAARARPRRRMPPGRRDLNRCFRPPWDGVDGQIAREALDVLRAPNLEAAVDLHNNTGHNPVYALGASLDGPHLALASLFATKYVETHLRLGTVQEALDDLAPTVTIECGRAGDLAGDASAVAGLRRLLSTDRIDPVLVTPEPFTVLVDPVRVVLRPGVTVAFGTSPRDGVALTLDLEIDRHNFEVLPAGAHLGWVEGATLPIVAQDETGFDVAPKHFAVRGRDLVTTHSFVPIMMTTDPAAATSDCLFYIARRRE